MCVLENVQYSLPAFMYLYPTVSCLLICTAIRPLCYYSFLSVIITAVELKIMCLVKCLMKPTHNGSQWSSKRLGCQNP